MAKSAFDEKELVNLRAEIRALREALDALKARPAVPLHPEYSVLVSSQLRPDYAVLVRPGNELPPDYAVLVRNPRGGEELARFPEYAVAVRPVGRGALPPEYAVLVRPDPRGPDEVLVVKSLRKAGAGKKTATGRRKPGTSKPAK